MSHSNALSAPYLHLPGELVCQPSIERVAFQGPLKSQLTKKKDNEATKLLILLYREIEYKSIKLRCLLRFRSNQLEERIASPGVRIGKARKGKKSKIYGPTPQQQEGVSPSKALRQEHNN